MVKSAAILAILPAASAFVAPMPKMAARGRSLQMGPFDDEPGRVQWFPSSPPYWDPLGFSADGDVAKFNKYKSIEIKHGRVAMLAALDYLVRGFGYHLPGDLGGVPIDSIPVGVLAIPKVPLFGWAQILAFASALEVLTPQKEDRVIGNVQPDSPIFPVPGTPTDQTKEINNGRLAMVAMAGIWVGELLTGGQNPIETAKPYALLS